MTRPTLVQKRALLAAQNNVEKAEKEWVNAQKAWRNSINWMGGEGDETEAAWRKVEATRSKFTNARARLTRLEEKTGVNGLTVNYSLFKRNALLSRLLRHPRVQQKMWARGLEREKKRALANFALWSSPSAFKASPVRSPTRKTPSPPRARGPSPRSPATLAREAALGIMGGARRPRAPANNTRVTWARRANGTINRFKTLENINLKLTNAQRNALEQMSENQAKNTIRQLARAR